ncbi:XRE family transcriptional regulator [Streptomyces naganishii]|uniref:XRE family transcriptional regulator n=1 Tax=Streptomyces naganishii TaxID=285447 RepID=UPI0036AC300F
MGENLSLKGRMDDLGINQDELAFKMNDALWDLTGRPGDFSSRTVRNWLSGKVTRPVGKTCAALERVFGCRVEDLGFTAPSSMKRSPEAPVRRRDFIASTTGSAAGAAPVIRRRHSVGMSDVQRATAGMDALIAADDRHGGHRKLATAALEARSEILDLQGRSASQRVRNALYALAAEFTTIAAWAYIDLRELDAAQKHLHESTTFAGLSQDAPTEMRVWMNVTMLAYQRRNGSEQLAAAQAALACTAARRDPFFGSMGRVRVALAQATLGDSKAAQRSLGTAQEALRKAAEDERPRWTAFYGPAELNHLASIIMNRNGAYGDAEAMAHRALSRIPKEFRRNRALATCQLASAQLHQGEPEAATKTAANVFAIMDGAPLPGRMRTLVGDFHRDLFRLAPSTSYARDWADRTRDEWSRA